MSDRSSTPPPPRSVATLLPAKSAPLTGEARVLRALPRRELRRVGPFVFLDHFGPVAATREAMDVPPHPHVGLQTVTYLFEGAVKHTDSLGSEQVIRPGDVNWMTAGKGIVHAELVQPEAEVLHGVQTWVGLPRAHRAVEPAFAHFGAASLPMVEGPGARARVIAGRLGDVASPVPTFQPVTYVDVALAAGASIELPVHPEHALAIYTAMGAVGVEGAEVPAGTLGVLTEGGASVTMRAGGEPARALLLGGAPLEEPTVIWWNFVVDSVAEGRAREDDWKAGRFPQMPG